MIKRTSYWFLIFPSVPYDISPIILNIFHYYLYDSYKKIIPIHLHCSWRWHLASRWWRSGRRWRRTRSWRCRAWWGVWRCSRRRTSPRTDRRARVRARQTPRLLILLLLLRALRWQGLLLMVVVMSRYMNCCHSSAVVCWYQGSTILSSGCWRCHLWGTRLCAVTKIGLC